MSKTQFIELLNKQSIAHKSSDNLIEIMGGDVNLRDVSALPSNCAVQFNNQGYVDLTSLTSLTTDVQFNNQGGVYLRSLTSLTTDVQFNNQGYVDLTRLTSITTDVQFNNQGDVYLRSLTSPKQTYKGKDITLRYIDGYTMLMGNSRTQGDYTIHRARYFGGGEISNLKQCYIAEYDGFYAHGDNVKDAIEDLEFKLVENQNKQEVVERIKSTQSVTVPDFRAITGACRNGMRHHLSQRGIDMDEVQRLPLSDAIDAMSGSYHGDKFIEMVGAL